MYYLFVFWDIYKGGGMEDYIENFMTVEGAKAHAATLEPDTAQIVVVEHGKLAVKHVYRNGEWYENTGGKDNVS